MVEVLLVGAGQLGSRYLQGLIASKFGLRITVVDVSQKALEIAKSRWIAAGGEESQHQVRWLDSLPQNMHRVDVALIVTPSIGRANLVKRIANSSEVRYWILEKVLAVSSRELKIIQSALVSSDGAWVNTPRRMMAWHRSLRDVFASSCPLEISYSAGLWGLACNSIHFIDLVAWWSGESLESVDIDGLDHLWYKSKREGYAEVTGGIVCTFTGGTKLYLNSKQGANPQPIQVKLSDGIIWQIDETAGTAISSNGGQIDGCIELQSQLTARLIDTILTLGKSLLPTFDESSAMHAIFLDAMLAHWNLSQHCNDDLVPIT